jgi:hypothetical protein
MKKLNLDDFAQVPEERVRAMCAQNGGERSSFYELLKIADEWRAAGCTPIFIVTDDSEDHYMMACVAQECFGTYRH